MSYPKPLNTPYPLIDADPHVKRVLSYMRPVDYAVWGGATFAAPAALNFWERIDPSKSAGYSLRNAGRLATVVGFVGGFLLAYQSSAQRFLGFKENQREQEIDMEEMTKRAKQGLPLYGESDLTPYLQGVAARNSTYSVFKIQAIPWFNFVNHPYHGVDVAKYYKAAGVPVPSAN